MAAWLQLNDISLASKANFDNCSVLRYIALHNVTTIIQSCRKSTLLSERKITYHDYCAVNILS